MRALLPILFLVLSAWSAQAQSVQRNWSTTNPNPFAIRGIHSTGATTSAYPWVVTLLPGGGGTAQTNISYTAVTNAPWGLPQTNISITAVTNIGTAAYSNVSAFTLSGAVVDQATHATNADTAATSVEATYATNWTLSKGTSNYLAKSTGTNAIIDSVIYETGGLVGVSTTTPQGKFQILTSGALNSDTDGNTEVIITGPNHAMDSSGNLKITSNSTTADGAGGSLVFGGRYSGASDASFAMIRAGQVGPGGGTSYKGTLSFGTRDIDGSMKERMTILNDGNVGIGTTTPNTPLHVKGATNQAVATFQTVEYSSNLTAKVSFINFSDTNSLSVGDISGVSSGTIAYNTFSGSHYTKIDVISNLFMWAVCELDNGKPRWNDVLVTPGTVTVTTSQVPVLVWQTNTVTTNWFAYLGAGDFTNVFLTNYVGVQVQDSILSSVVTTNYVERTNNAGQLVWRPRYHTNAVLLPLTETVISSVTNVAEYKKSAIQDQLFKSAVATTRRSGKVIGVYAGQDTHGRDRVIGLGVGKVWVANVNAGTNGVALGDLLITSGIPGHAEVDDQNNVRQSTLGRATERVIWNVGETNRLISCVLKSG